jgi:excisionase family DNA binding protein
MTVGEVARELRVDGRTVRNWIRAGLLVAVRVGRQYRVERAALDAFVAGKEKPQERMISALAYAS